MLVLHDVINELQLPQAAVRDDQASDGEYTDPVAETEPVLVAIVSKKATTTAVADQVIGLVKLTDVAAFLPHREYEIHGGQISGSNSDLCKQIDEGLAEGLTDAEVIKTVLKIIKSGTFKDMLSTEDSLQMS